MADLKAFRKANKLTQEQVADYLGIKKPFICKIETGRESFPEKHLRKLLDNPHGWDITHLAEVSETPTETNNTPDTPEQPTEDVVVISTQMLEEMTAQRQLTEQALALVQEQLEAKQETIEAVREQLATTQEQLTTSQEHLTTSQEQLTTSQEQLAVEQRQVDAEKETTRALLAELAGDRAQMGDLIMMLKKSEARLERELEKMEQRIQDIVTQQNLKKEQSSSAISKSKTNDN